MGSDVHRHRPTTDNSCGTRRYWSPGRRPATRAWLPRDRDLLYVLAPAPNLDRGTIDWASTGGAYAEDMISIRRRTG